jgi:hypothetical protein
LPGGGQTLARASFLNAAASLGGRGVVGGTPAKVFCPGTARAARAGTTPSTTMMSTLVFISATASSGRRATFPSPHCGRSTKLRPCTQPWSTRPRRNASRSPFRGWRRAQETDTPHTVGLLRTRRKRPRRRAAEQCDELAPPHSITSSARASRVGGTSRPSASRS